MLRFFIFIVFLCVFNVSNVEATTLKVATSTSTENSGLLTYLIPHFTNLSNIEIEYTAVGTGAALKLGREGKVDVLLVHAAKAEKAFMDKGYGSRREFIMFNDFVFVGADSTTFNDLNSFFKYVIDNEQQFVSRGDNSGTHKKEEALWLAYNYDPIGEPWYIETGYGMGKTLVEANSRRAFTLIDRGTWLAKEDQVDLQIVFENSAQLLNPYSAIVVNSASSNSSAANQFVDWLLTENTQQLIADYRVNNKILFKPAAKYY